MKLPHLPIIWLSLSAICLFSCRKSDNPSVSSHQQLLAAAKDYYQKAARQITPAVNGNFRHKHLRSINWDQAQVYYSQGDWSVSAPVDYDQDFAISTNFSGGRIYHLSDLTHLVYQYRGDTPILALVTAFPDSNYSKKDRKKFSGIMLFEDLRGNPIGNFRFDHSGMILSRQILTGKSSPISLSQKPVEPTVWITTCYQIEGFNYAADNPNEVYRWVEDAGCSSAYLPVYFGDDAGGYSAPGYGEGGLPSPTATPSIVAVNHGPNLIANIQDYFKCFTNVGGNDHSYSITVCVNQPAPGTRQAWSFQSSVDASSGAANIFNAGHVFLIFNETYGFTNIRRNVGFYPQDMVAPGMSTSPGELDNNDRSSYNISLTLKLDNGQFFNMLNFVTQGGSPGFLYDLNSNNCTTFVINALQSAGINISWHSGSWPGGSGYNPGDMGEDIRSMELGANMSRGSIPFSHPNQGNCN